MIMTPLEGYLEGSWKYGPLCTHVEHDGILVLLCTAEVAIKTNIASIYFMLWILVLNYSTFLIFILEVKTCLLNLTFI